MTGVIGQAQGAAGNGGGAGVVVPLKKRRQRWGKLPKPDKRADLYWGVNQPELANITDGQLTRLLIDTPEFEEVLGPKLDAIDERNRTGWGNQAGRPVRWRARDLEALLVYRRVTGTSTVKRARERLSFDREAQELLELPTPLPSAPTITRYLRQHFDAQERVELYRELDRRLRKRVMELEGFDKEATKLGLDGSQHGTAYTPPIPEAINGVLTGKMANGHLPKGTPGAITAPDAGFVGKEGGPKSGQGWQFVGLFTEHGTLLSWDISPLHKGETEAAQRVFEDYETHVHPHRGQRTISVCTADGGFNSHKLRAQMQALRIIPNVHKASHSNQERTRENVERLSNNWIPFVHPARPNYAKWLTNGLGQIACSCGAGSTERIFNVSKTGALTIATKGVCQSCGTVTITAGKWRRAQNPSRVVRAFGQPADPAIGNPLHYFDPLARELGKDRFGWGESLHATLMRRFGLLKPRSFMRSGCEVETQFAIATSAISVLLLERAARRGESQRALPAAA